MVAITAVLNRLRALKRRSEACVDCRDLVEFDSESRSLRKGRASIHPAVIARR